MVGALFTDRIGDYLNVFCLYLNGDMIQFSLPLEGNLDGVDHLFKQLDMFEKCNSAIVGQAVRGRIYVQEKEINWMYTLLATTGSLCPPLDASIHTLPWKRVWFGGGTEILRLDRWRGKEYCYAVRGRIGEGELSNTLRESKALVHPLVAERKQARLPLIAAATAAALVFALLLWFGYRQFSHRNLGRPLVVAARPLVVSQKPVATPVVLNYVVMAEHEMRGPFPLEKILELAKSDELPADAMVRSEGSADWENVTEFVTKMEKAGQ
ncbi:MAG: DUF4339 domain-containing protein [Verrucomicrobia bacterium]|nr:MAG: DUF4339 domain-containing protein [Verrucomicrobiota bacterium]